MSKSREEFIKEIAEPMRKTALENVYFSHEKLHAAVLSGKHSKFLRVANTIAIQVILNISPSDDLSEMFWHISMSIVSYPKSVAKTVGLWTKNEKQNIGGFLVEFLGDCGNRTTQRFGRTAKALHCYRDLTESEMAEILLRKGV